MRENLTTDQILDRADNFIRATQQARTAYGTDRLQWTRPDRINPLPSTKRNPRMARRIIQEQEKHSYNLAEIRGKGIENLVKE